MGEQWQKTNFCVFQTLSWLLSSSLCRSYNPITSQSEKLCFRMGNAESRFVVVLFFLYSFLQKATQYSICLYLSCSTKCASSDAWSFWQLPEGVEHISNSVLLFYLPIVHTLFESCDISSSCTAFLALLPHL